MTGPSCVTVLYGSETGTAKEAALTVAEMLQRRGVTSVSLNEMDGIDIASWAAMSPVVFVCSTTGQGNIPRTMSCSWDALRMEDAPEVNGLLYAVFGLGDSSYEKFNYSAKMLHNRLAQLGGEPVVHRGLGDDQDAGGYEQEMMPWLEQLFKVLQLGPVSATMPPPLLTVEVLSGALEERVEAAVREVATLQGRLVASSRITSESHFQQVQHIELDLGSAASYEPGDALCVYAPNDSTSVARTARVLRLPLDATVVVRPNVEPGSLASQPHQPHFGQAISLRALLTHQLEIDATASRRFLRMLASFAADAEEQERLEELASAAHIDEFNSYCHREKRVIAEVLEDFPQIRPPLGHVLSCFPPIKSRAFSISSAPSDPTVHLTVAKLEFTTPYGRHRTGICSGWLCGLPVGSMVECFLQRGTIALPQSSETPLVMVGPGTGVAPLRAMVRARIRDGGAGASTAGKMVLVTGNRNRAHDFLYGDEFADLAARYPDSFEHVPVFSRDGDQRRYVQHALAEKKVAAGIGAMISAGACIYVCGNAKQMPRDVENTFVSIVHHFQTRTDDESDARRFVAQLKKQGRYMLETWSS